MRVYKYKVFAPEDSKSVIKGKRDSQIRIYIPNKGVLGYGFVDKKVFDFFSDSSDLITEGEKAKSKTLEGSKYLGEIDISDRDINDLIRSFNEKNDADDEFKRRARDLVSSLT
jgi:hypothetical protein